MKKNIIIFCLINGLSISSISSGTVIKSAYMEILITQNTTVLHNVHPNGVTTPQWKCCFRIDFNTISPKIILISHTTFLAKFLRAEAIRMHAEE